MTALELVAMGLGGVAVGLALGLLLGRRTLRLGLSELEAYLDGWFDAKRDDADAMAAAATRSRPLYGNVYGKLGERRQAFWELRDRSEMTGRQLQRLVDVMSDEALVYDAAGRLLFASDEIRALGSDATGAPGAGPADTPAEIDAVVTLLATQGELQDLIRRALAGENCAPVELTLGTEPRRRRFVGCAYAVSGGGGDGLLVLLTPLELVEELRRAGERRVALEHVTLAAERTAHRLRNPLNSIVLLVEVLRREAARSRVPLPGHHLESVEAEVAKLEATLQGFLETVRRRERREETVNLAEVVEAVAELLYPVSREAGVQVRQDLHAASATVLGDGREVVRALLGPALGGVREAAAGEGVKFRLDSDRREHVVWLEIPGLTTAPMDVAVAGELAERNGGWVEHQPGRPLRLAFRFPAIDPDSARGA